MATSKLLAVSFRSTVLSVIQEAVVVTVGEKRAGELDVELDGAVAIDGRAWVAGCRLAKVRFMIRERSTGRSVVGGIGWGEDVETHVMLDRLLDLARSVAMNFMPRPVFRIGRDARRLTR
jgi:hypothetical protein